MLAEFVHIGFQLGGPQATAAHSNSGEPPALVPFEPPSSLLLLQRLPPAPAGEAMELNPLQAIPGANVFTSLEPPMVALLPQNDQPDSRLVVDSPAELTGLTDTPLVGIIDTAFCASVGDLDVVLFSGMDRIDGDSDPIAMAEDSEPTACTELVTELIEDDFPSLLPDAGVEALWLGRADEHTWAESLVEFVNTALVLGFEQAIVTIPISQSNAPDAAEPAALTVLEQAALTYASQNGVMVIQPMFHTAELLPSADAVV